MSFKTGEQIQKYIGKRKDNGETIVGHALVFGQTIRIYDPDSLFLNEEGIETIYGYDVIPDSIEEFSSDGF